MKLLIVTQVFWPEDFRINDLTVALRERGHEVTVLTGIPNYPAGRFFPGYGIFRNRRQTYHGVHVIRAPLIPRGRGTPLRLVLNYLSFALFATLLAPFYCRGKFDAIFVFETSPVTVGIPAILLKRIKRAPILFWVLDLWPDSLSAVGAVKSPLLLSWVGSLVRFIYKHCDLILVQSRAFNAQVERFGATPEKIRYFPSWAENLYQPTCAQPGILPVLNGFRIMFAGNIAAAQDFDTILRAAEILKTKHDIHWLIVGDGRKCEWSQQQTCAMGLTKTVHFLGRYPTENMPAFFAEADVMLVSLKRAPIFALTIPGKIQSYLACGRPILAMLDGEGARVVEESGAGISCPAEDAESLAEAVLCMYGKTREERELMGRRGRRYYEENFDRSVLFTKLESWMRELARAEKD